MQQEKLLIVNKDDKLLGIEAKEIVHQKGILHRAITVFIFNNKNELLITKRAKDKILWPLFWESSCSTHVFPNESYQQAGKRRLLEEIGIQCKLKLLTKFYYKAQYQNIGYEHEICALLIGNYNKKIIANRKEIAEYKWLSLNKLNSEIEKNSKKYAPWFKIAFAEYIKHVT